MKPLDVISAEIAKHRDECREKEPFRYCQIFYLTSYIFEKMYDERSDNRISR